MKMISKTSFLLLILFCTYFRTEGQNNANPVIIRFEYGDVRLTGGRLKQQLDETTELYLNISNDDLLKGFRERAGLPTHGARDLGGWYSNDVFHTFGQYLSGLSRLYAATGNEACRTKVNELMEGWAETIEPDGFFFYTKKPNVFHYTYEKMQAGLLDAYLFAKQEKALEYMSLITDWAIRNLDPDRNYPYSPGQGNNEWYTLSENLYRAYLATGDKKYLDFAKFWEYSDFWGAVRGERDMQLNKISYHAYSHLNSLSGAAMAYKVEQDQKYLNTAINGYDFFVDNQAYITGGFGPIEQVVSLDAKKVVTDFTHNTFETQCGSWAGLKLSKYLLEFTGNGRYGDWIEKLLINGIGASLPMTQSGAVMYYSDYNCKHAEKRYYNSQWTCCTGTRPQAIADYANLVYFKDNNGIYVNYFTPSTVQWNDVKLEQATGFPEAQETSIAIHTPQPKSFDINIRKPLWLDGRMTVTVNGKKFKPVEKNGWMVLSREWKQGDKIKATMPMSFHVKRLHPDYEYPLAMAYGPVAMAITGIDHSYPLAAVHPSKPGKNLVAQPGKKLTWKVKDHPEWLVKGFYQLDANEPYVLYVNNRAGNLISYDSVKTTGNWNDRSFYRTAAKESSISAEGAGSGMRVYCWKSRNGGKARVELNGKDMGIIDLYGDGDRIHEHFDFLDEGAGRQSLKLTVLGEKNEKSKGQIIYVLGFETLP